MAGIKAHRIYLRLRLSEHQTPHPTPYQKANMHVVKLIVEDIWKNCKTWAFSREKCKGKPKTKWKDKQKILEEFVAFVALKITQTTNPAPHHSQVRLIPGMQGLFNTGEKNVFYHVNRLAK